MIYNANRAANAKAWTWVDVFPEWKEPERPQTEEEMLQAMYLWARMGPYPATSN